MSATAWFDNLKAKGLVDFKCAIGSSKSSFSAVCQELMVAQNTIESDLGGTPNVKLRPDSEEIAALRRKLVESFSN